MQDHVASEPVPVTDAGTAAGSTTLMIVGLSVAAFASSVGMRAADLLLPEIGREFGVTPGAASIIVTLFAICYGAVQFVAGPVSDRIGKVRIIVLACFVSFGASLICAMASSLDQLTIARMIAGFGTGAIIPSAMAFIGDAVSYEKRQSVLARFLFGQIFGMIFGQATGGIVAETFGWRAMFLILGAIFAVAAVTVLLLGRRFDRAGGLPSTPTVRPPIRRLLAGPRVRTVLTIVFLEGIVVYGAFTFVGSDLHDRGGMGLGMAGLTLMAFGLGGFIYVTTVSRLVRAVGRVRLPLYGAALLGVGYLVVAAAPWLPAAGVGLLLIGFGFYMFHNTLQTEATQMVPEARGFGVSLFASIFFCAQSAGAAIGGWVYDAYGATPLYAVCIVGLPLIAVYFSRRLAAWT